MEMERIERRARISEEQLQQLIEKPELSQIGRLGRLPGRETAWFTGSNDFQITQWVHGRYLHLVEAGFTEKDARTVVLAEYHDARVIPNAVLDPALINELRPLLREVNSPLVD